ncbi:hypothetical protein B0H16DRAFT_1494834 [Mycena metata]|uniref:Uncharacterized protein n=1 Tax=Mycena metata TaxID=1033252 RepID=A0AAD7KD57_9AGAR|nr:hypothetical protein B0H16DRAFT_1494834 [Mycena metata]
MDHELPRISIPSMGVWHRIKGKFAKEVNARVEKYAKDNRLPAERKNAMLRNAEKYVEDTFRMAQANIRVNGRDFDSLQPHEQDAEPFDEALDRQIWALASNRLEWHRKIALERRETPVKVENALQQLLEEHEALDAEVDESIPDDEMMSDGPQLDVDEKVVGQILAATGELTQTLRGQQERSERSRAVEAEFKALKP